MIVVSEPSFADLGGTGQLEISRGNRRPVSPPKGTLRTDITLQDINKTVSPVKSVIKSLQQRGAYQERLVFVAFTAQGLLKPLPLVRIVRA